MVELKKDYKIGKRRFGKINWIGSYTLYKKETLRFLIVFGLTILGISGVISIYLSNTSVIVLCTVGFYLLYQATVLGHRIYPLLLIIFIWVNA